MMMHVLHLKMIHAFCTNMTQASTRRGGATQYCVLYKVKGSHIIVSTTRKRDHTVLYHQQGGGLTQLCIINKIGGTVLFLLQGGGSMQYCILNKKEGSHSI